MGLAHASEQHTRAEIEPARVVALHRAFAADREPTEKDLADVMANSVPLAVTMAEPIERLRHWAKGRARGASSSATASDPALGRRGPGVVVVADQALVVHVRPSMMWNLQHPKGKRVGRPPGRSAFFLAMTGQRSLTMVTPVARQSGPTGSSHPSSSEPRVEGRHPKPSSRLQFPCGSERSGSR